MCMLHESLACVLGMYNYNKGVAWETSTCMWIPILSAVKAGSDFFGRICTSVVNLAPALRAPLHLSESR